MKINHREAWGYEKGNASPRVSGCGGRRDDGGWYDNRDFSNGNKVEGCYCKEHRVMEKKKTTMFNKDNVFDEGMFEKGIMNTE